MCPNCLSQMWYLLPLTWDILWSLHTALDNCRNSSDAIFSSFRQGSRLICICFFFFRKFNCKVSSGYIPYIFSLFKQFWFLLHSLVAKLPLNISTEELCYEMFSVFAPNFRWHAGLMLCIVHHSCCCSGNLTWFHKIYKCLFFANKDLNITSTSIISHSWI